MPEYTRSTPSELLGTYNKIKTVSKKYTKNQYGSIRKNKEENRSFTQKYQNKYKRWKGEPLIDTSN